MTEPPDTCQSLELTPVKASQYLLSKVRGSKVAAGRDKQSGTSRSPGARADYTLCL